MFNVSSNINEVLGYTARLSSQFNFAVASALTETVKTVRNEMPAALDRELHMPTRYTKAGFFFVGARKDALVAHVGIKDAQAKYLHYQIYGGDRFPNRKALKLPGQVKLDDSGNIPRAELRRLIAEAKRVRKASAKRRVGGTSYTGSSKGVFYGKPANRPELPPGIYRRVQTDDKARFLQPLVLFPAQAAKYKPRFDFFGLSDRIARQTFPQALRRTWARALATAR